MPRNAEKKVCTVCNQIVDTDDAESDSGSVLGSLLEEVASNPQMKNAKQLANLDPNKLYLTCGTCTQTFRRMKQMMDNYIQNEVLNAVGNRARTNGEANTSKRNLKSAVVRPANAISSVDGENNVQESSARAVDLQNGNVPLNDNVKDVPVDAPGSDLKQNSAQDAGQTSNCVDCTTTETGRNLLGLPPPPAAGKKDDVFLFPPPRDTLLQKRKANRPKAPPPPSIQDWTTEKAVADTSDEEWVDFVIHPYSEGEKDEQVVVPGASTPTTNDILEVVIDISSENEEEQRGELPTPIIIDEPESAPVILPSEDNEMEQEVETPIITSRKKLAEVASRRSGQKRRYSKRDWSFTNQGDIPAPRRGRSSRSLPVQPLSSSSSTNAGDQSGSAVGARNESVIGTTLEKAGSSVPSTSSGLLLGISPSHTNQRGAKKPNAVVKPAIARKKKVPKRKYSKDAKTPVKQDVDPGKGKGRPPRKTDKKDIEPPRKRAKNRRCCHLCPQDFGTKLELKNHWIKYHRINPAAIALMPSP